MGGGHDIAIGSEDGYILGGKVFGGFRTKGLVLDSEEMVGGTGVGDSMGKIGRGRGW